jgi:CDP-diacylglycerol---glycerol-3-phosphate 3-phosphatidyltransferase
LALNAYARAVTDRVVVPIAKGMVKAGATPNWITFIGLVTVLAGVGVVLTGRPFAGAVVMAFGTALDAFDGAVARLRGTSGPFGAFYDSVTDRISDAAIFGAAAWLVRENPTTFVVAMVAMGGAQITPYIRAKAESFGWDATVGVIERAERVIILIAAIGFGFLPLALWVLAIGGVITIAQRLVAVVRQAYAT